MSIRQFVKLHFICKCALFFLLATDGLTLVAQDGNRTQRAMTRIEAGTLVDNPEGKRWNRVVLLSRPSIESGDVSAISKTIRDAASSLVVTILATIEQTADESGKVRYRMTEVGVGTSVEIDGEWTVVTLENASQLGLSFGFFKRQLLYENDKQFRKLQLVAKTTTLAIFDAPAIVLRDGKHKDFVMRHFIWIDSRTGASAALVWLLERNETGQLSVVDEPAHWLPAGVKEKRTIHVDRQEFTFGIPGERAFALTELPPGKAIPWNDETRALSALTNYSMDELRQWTTGLNLALGAK